MRSRLVLPATGPRWRSSTATWPKPGHDQRETYDEEAGDWTPDPSDTCFQLRRALLQRGLLGVKADKPLKMDRGMLRAFLEIGQYRHGARSMQKLLDMVKQSGRPGVLRRSDLPSRTLMNLLVDPEEFFAIMTQDDAFKQQAEMLAPHVHQFYRDLAKRQGWKLQYDIPYDDLPPEIREDNVAAAMRIPEVLALAGLQVVAKDTAAGALSQDEARKIIDGHLELLAEAEHDGWTDHKLLNGWRYGTQRNDTERVHDRLVPYSQLPEEDKEKDRDAVRNYPEIVDRAGFVISREPAPTND